MLQTILSNLGILLLMYLTLSTVGLYTKKYRLSFSMESILYIIIVILTLISLQAYPVKAGDHIFSLCVIPIVMVTLFKGWRYGITAALYGTFHWIFFGGMNEAVNAVFLIFLPMLVTIPFNKIDKRRHGLLRIFGVLSLAFFVSEIPIITMGSSTLEYIIVDYITVVLCGLIIAYFLLEQESNLMLEEDLQRMGEKDPLTGLSNMRSFEKAVANFTKTPYEKYIVMVDIDYFKLINDQFGHQVGDEVIKGVGQVLGKYENDNVLVGRYGGDEYILFVALSSKFDAINFLESIRSEIENKEFIKDLPELKGKIKISMGISSLNDSNNFSKAVLEADKLLYESKRRGRNQICG